MKPSILFFALAAVFLIPLETCSAHDTIELPAPGHVDFSTFWVVVGGEGYLVWWDENQSGAMTAFGYHAVTTNYNAGGTGLDSMIEIGVAPGFSLGLQLSFPEILLSYLQGFPAYLDVSFSAALDLVHAKWFGLQTRLEVEATPLLGLANGVSAGEGYFNLYFTLGASARLYEKREDFVAAYLDAKAITSFENPAYRNPVRDFESFLGLPSGFADGLPGKTGPVYKFILATGIEARFGWFMFYIGYNFPLFGFTQYYVTGPVGNTFFDFSNIEFSWRFRL